LRFDERYEGIIFDDMNFNHIHREGQIQLVDNDIMRSIHCRYSVARIPAHTKKVFTTNVVEGGIFMLEDGAIKRRVKVLKYLQ